MKFCWNNIENIKLTENGNFRDVVKKKTYYYCECLNCKEPFLGIRKDSLYCCYSCSSKHQWNDPSNAFNSEETRKKISQSVKELWKDENYKKNFSETIKEMYRDKNSVYNSPEFKKKMSESRRGKKNGFWKGGYYSKNIPTYDTHASQLDWCEEVRRKSDDENVLEVRCTYCGKWYVPTFASVRNRILSLYGHTDGECRLYCSDHCKKACPTYGKTPHTLMKEDAIRAGRLQWLELNREVQPELRKMVLKRDNYTCQKCGTVDSILHCHHILPVSTNPLESADVDNCITYCIDCHKQAHDQDGCRYNDLKEEIC